LKINELDGLSGPQQTPVAQYGRNNGEEVF